MTKSSKLKDALIYLRTCLLNIDADGENSFESLLAIVLSEIVGQEFRLAKKGSQGGRDGGASFGGQYICFEAKLYSSRLKSADLIAKLADIAIDDAKAIDVWILGATREVSEQDNIKLHKLAAELGVEVLILDWGNSHLPQLAVLMATAADTATDFLVQNAKKPVAEAELVEVLKAIKDDDRFSDRSKNLIARLTGPSVGLWSARQSNAQWLETTFSDRNAAKNELGQPLAPKADAALYKVERPALAQKIIPKLSQSDADRDLVILGGDGNGKSWIVAQTWLSLKDRPLMIILTSDSMDGMMKPNDIEDVIIQTIIQQTNDRGGDASRERWARRFRIWREKKPLELPNILIFLDGLNQNTSVDYWPARINRLSKIISELGGNLIITCREKFYKDRIEPNLYSTPEELEIPEFTNPEVMSALSAVSAELKFNAKDIKDIHRNPRLLGIAVEIWKRSDISDFSELNLGRLLFEYLQVMTPVSNDAETVQEYAANISRHAKEIQNRLLQQERNDLFVFPGAWKDDISAITEGRFFEPLDDDPTQYTLRDDALSFALGISLADALREAFRNGQDLSSKLDDILDPIGSLDTTAEIVFSALSVACLDKHYDYKIGAALIEHYLQLQNLDEDNFPAFSSFARTAIASFLSATEAIYLSRNRTINQEWIEQAMLAAREDPASWARISKSVREWLSSYSFHPQFRSYFFNKQGSTEEVAEKRERESLELVEKLDALTKVESQFIEKRLICNEGAEFGDEEPDDLDALYRLSFSLMAGKPLAAFADVLVNWSFAQSLNGSVMRHFQDFRHLVRLNRTDWKETQSKLHEELAVLQSNSLSEVGKWTVVESLRATGCLDDAADAEQLAKPLLASRNIRSTRIPLERYCESDPCDPGSARPDNITQTVIDYENIDTTVLSDSDWKTAEGRFFEDARAGLARFELATAVKMLRQFVSNVTEGKTGRHLTSIDDLKQHTPLLTGKHVEDMLTLSRTLVNIDDDGSHENHESKISGQMGLLLCFPFLTGEQQLEELISLPDDAFILLQTTYALKPIEMDPFEARLDSVFDANELTSLCRLLIFAHYTSTELSESARETLSELAISTDGKVRCEALGTIWRIEDETLTRSVAEAGWSAAKLHPKDDFYERWYGSGVILNAAKIGALPIDQALDRMIPAFHGKAARYLGDEATTLVAHFLDAALTKILPTHNFPGAPQMEREVISENTKEPPLVSISEELTDSSQDIKGFFERLNENPEQFSERQSGFHDKYEDLVRSLTANDARLALEDTDPAGFLAIAKANPDFVLSWFNRFTAANANQMRHLTNMALMTATALSGREPQKSSKLFRHISGSSAFISLVTGVASIPLESTCVWKSHDSAELDQLRFERLDSAVNDNEIAVETLAALTEGKDKLVLRYIQDRIDTKVPAHVARALTVAGFCDKNEVALQKLVSFSGAVGFIGEACDAARSSYDKNLWARHWHKEICNAQSPEEFWSNGILRNKIVDGRIELWETEYQIDNPDLQVHQHSSDAGLKNRVKAWSTKRCKTLFGQSCPDVEFLVPQ